MQLTVNRRCDQRLFDFYSGLGVYCCDDAQLQRYLIAARQQFPLVAGRMADTHLVISHGDRMNINSLMNSVRRTCEDNFIVIPAPKYCSSRNAPQTMYV